MSDNLETMESPEAISATLDEFLANRTPISISPIGINDFFTSFIIKIEGDHLYIDQVIPRTGNDLFKTSQSLNVRTSYKGISYRFKSQHISYAIDSSGFPYHEITLPSHIQYLEKRSSCRIHLKLSDNQPIKIAIPPGEFCEASLENISNSGACFRLQGNHTPLETCDVIDCAIQVADADPFTCQAVIKHYQYSPKTNETKAGVKFCQLSTPAEKQLHRILMKLQRHNIRTDLTI